MTDETPKQTPRTGWDELADALAATNDDGAFIVQTSQHVAILRAAAHIEHEAWVKGIRDANQRDDDAISR